MKFKNKILVTAALLLPACSPHISKDFMKGMQYREAPVVEIVEYEDECCLQAKCKEIHDAFLFYYTGCVTIPYNPKEVCTIHIMEGDQENLEHEMWHCHGYADTYLPWKRKNLNKEARK